LSFKTSSLAAAGRRDELDLLHLSEYLNDMAQRDRREVKNRLVKLLSHLLRWDHLPGRRTGLWRSKIRMQRWQLRDLLESATLYRHAGAVLADAYAAARQEAAAQTGLPPDAFPAACPWGLDGLLAGPGG